ncbi:MAG: CoA transferase [Candidatus Berkiellales bacterium]
MKDSIQQFFTLPPVGPLNGYLVLEIGGNVSGPMATEKLAREGACVIKVELAGGDPARNYLSHSIFTSCNAGKASIVINKSKAEDQKIYQEILGMAHVIVDNRSPDAKMRDEDLQQFLHGPKTQPVIFCSIVGYDSQEFHDRSALDVAVQAEIGMAMVNGAAPHQPLKVGFVVIDITTGWEAASAVKSHLLALERGIIKIPESKVIFLEQSMAKTGAMLLSGQYLATFEKKQDSFRKGNRDLWLAPFSFYKTRDDMISIAIIGDPLFKTFCEKVLYVPELVEKYPTNQSRLLNIDAFEQDISAILLQKSAAEWVERCQEHGIVCCKVNTISEMLAQPFAKQMITFTATGTPIIADPCRSSAYPAKALVDAPKLNEHREAILELLNTGKDFSEMYDFFCRQGVRSEAADGLLPLYHLHKTPDSSNPTLKRKAKL